MLAVSIAALALAGCSGKATTSRGVQPPHSIPSTTTAPPPTSTTTTSSVPVEANAAQSIPCGQTGSVSAAVSNPSNVSGGGIEFHFQVTNTSATGTPGHCTVDVASNFTVADNHGGKFPSLAAGANSIDPAVAPRVDLSKGPIQSTVAPPSFDPSIWELAPSDSWSAWIIIPMTPGDEGNTVTYDDGYSSATWPLQGQP
jgi:hypothetical protein